MSRLSRLLRAFPVFLFIFVIFYSNKLALAQVPAIYSIQDIAPGTLSDTEAQYFPKKINDNGYITGFKYTQFQYLAQHWVSGQEFPAGNFSSVGNDISNSNIVVGRGYFGIVTNVPQHRAFTYSPSAQNFFWLPCPIIGSTANQEGTFCEAYAINVNGMIVGTSDSRYIYLQGSQSDARALMWNSGSATELFPGAVGVANDINSLGAIVGMVGYQPFVRKSNGTVQLLGNLSNSGTVGQMVYAQAINDSGHVVGGHTVNSNGSAQRAFYWNGATAVDIGDLGVVNIPVGTRTPIVGANDVNNRDQVVGAAVVGVDQANVPVTHAFIWDQQNGIRDLNNLIPSASNIVLTEATGINNNGDIVAAGYVIGNNPYIHRAYLLKNLAPPPPVIFIPGISGSTLYEANEIGDPITHEYPDPRISAIWADGLIDLTGLTLRKLYLDPEPSPIVAVDALEKVANKPIYEPLFEYLRVNGYVRYQIGLNPKKRLPQNCDENERYDGKKPNLFVFAYDWRMSNVESAKQLRDYIQCVQKFYPDQKVNILTHSMGGLVARSYLLQFPNDQKVDKLITTVAPFLGAPKVIDVLYTGRFLDPIRNWYPHRNRIRRIVTYSKAAHELLPSKWYYDLDGAPFGYRTGFLGLITDYTYPEAKQTLDAEFASHPYADASEPFHNSAGGQQDNWSLDSSGVKYYHLYGVQAYDQTPGKVLFLPLDGYLGGARKYRTEVLSTKGDKTVPALSASRAREGQNSLLIASNTVVKRCTSPKYSSDSDYEHTGIMGNPVFLDEIRTILNNSSINQPECQVEAPLRPGSSAKNNLVEPVNTERVNFLKIYGVDRLQITDVNGRTNTPIGEGVDEAVPGIDYEYGSEPSDSIVAPHVVTFKAGKGADIKFVAPSSVVRIELYQGTSAGNHAEAVKYLNLQLPAGVMASLKFTQIDEPGPTVTGKNYLRPHSLATEVANLRYDADGDGTFETEVQPTFNLSGAAANDTTPPSIGISYTMSNGVATVVASATDGGTGVRQIRYTVDGEDIERVYSAPFAVSTSQSQLIYVVAEDNAGNSNLLAKWIDTVAPNTGADQTPAANSAGWSKTDVALELKAMDDTGGSGIDTLTFSGSGAQTIPQETITKYYDPFTYPERATTSDFLSKTLSMINAEGTTNVAFYSKDRAGNTELSKAYTVRIDKSAPTTTYSPTSNGQKITFSLSATDVNSGVKEILYSIDGGTVQVYTAPFSVPITGGHYVSYFARDVAGNEEVLRTVFVNSATGHSQYDFDGDGRSDVSVFRPSDNFWYIARSQLGYTTQAFGAAGDVIAPADYDGDGKTEVAVFRPSNGTWYWYNLTTQALTTFQWGQSGDIPVPADYDGDGKADFTVFRPSDNKWYRVSSIDSSVSTTQFGESGDKPVVGDFDGDGKTDISVWRPSSGTWYMLRSTGLYTFQTWGITGDKPVPADYDGDGKTDLAVFRPSNNTWYRINSSDGAQSATAWGLSGDVPAPADYDGDSRTDLAVFRPSNGTWYIINSLSGISNQQFGLSGDVPTPSAFIY